jgi:hypothetical protein
MKFLLGLVCLMGVALLAWGAQSAQEDSVPAFHNTAPAKGDTLPAVLTKKQLSDAGFTIPAQVESYKAAATVPGLMYQLPCYCHCDRSHGHTSLHSCFESLHGAKCGTCLAEALYAYKKSKSGWNAKMIRDAIIRGDYKLVGLQHPDTVE